jgi:DNA-binding GntR family transcriptional regulator
MSASPVLAPVWQMLSRGVLVYLVREELEEVTTFDILIREHEELLSLLHSDSQQALDQQIEIHILDVMRQRRRALDRAPA